MHRFGPWASGDEVDDSGHRSRTIQSRGNTLNHLYLAQIHWRNLQQAQSASLLPEQRQAVAKKPGVAPAHTLDTHARRSQRRRGGLHPDTSHFIQHHDDIAWRHECLFFNLLRSQHFDSGRRILNARVGTRRVYGDLFFDFRLALQFHDHLPLPRFADRDGGRGRQETFLGDSDFDSSGWDRRNRHAAPVRLQRAAVECDLGT